MMSVVENVLDNELVQFGAGFIGFWVGVDAKFINQGGNPGTTYPFTVVGFGDMIAGVAGHNVAYTLLGSAGYPSTAIANRTFKILGWLNKGLLIAAGAYILEGFVHGIWKKVLKLLQCGGLGYALGGVFDFTVANNRGQPYTQAKVNPAVQRSMASSGINGRK